MQMKAKIKWLLQLKEKNKDPYEIAEFYTNRFMGDLQKLNIGKPEIICKATEHIKRNGRICFTDYKKMDIHMKQKIQYILTHQN